MKKNTSRLLGQYWWYVLVLIIGVGGMWWYYQHQRQTEVLPGGVTTTTAQTAPVWYSQLTGYAVSSTAEIMPKVVSVMIDNHPDARPQAGIAEAPVVYEAPAEGGITRYLTLFASDQVVSKVGPVRSARPYYLDWVREYGDIPYMHCGGSPEALSIIRKENIFDADQFFWDEYYWRATNRFAPHNLYTNSENWQKLLAVRGVKRSSSTWDGWVFTHDEVVGTSTVMKMMTVVYSSDYKVSWKYDPTTKKYLRFINNKPHLDEKGVQVAADNVVVEEMRMKVLDEAGRKELETIGSGSVRVLHREVLTRGTWKKENTYSRTRWYGEDGKEIALVPGVTWVQVVPVNTVVEVTH